MGGSYTNYTLRGPSQRTVATALAGRRAVVAPVRNGCVVAFDEVSDEQDTDRIAALATSLSRGLDCTVLAVLNHDDDILWYCLYGSGRLEDEYNSSPGYFDPSAGDSNPAGGGAAKLCAAFGANDVANIERILRRGLNSYAFARERHADLARRLEYQSSLLVRPMRVSSEESIPPGWWPPRCCELRGADASDKR